MTHSPSPQAPAPRRAFEAPTLTPHGRVELATGASTPAPPPGAPVLPIAPRR